MSYRTNTKEDIEEKSDLIIHDMTDIWFKPNMDVTKCPFCKEILYFTKEEFCCPTNRFSTGLLWWKKVCSINNNHRHYICGVCNSHWIKRSEFAKWI